MKPVGNIKSIENIFTIPKDALAKEEYFRDDKILLDIEYLKNSLILLDGYDEAYLNLKEEKITTYDFFEKLVEFSNNWNLKFIVTSRKTCMNNTVLDNLYNGIYKSDNDEDIPEKNKIQICQLSSLTKQQQKDWINNKYNKFFPYKKYDIKKYIVHVKKTMNNLKF